MVHDPASNQFYRLSPIAHELVCTLDGARSVEESWNLSLEVHGDEAPTQPEVIELLGQMYNSNLLAMDTTPETEQLLSRAFGGRLGLLVSNFADHGKIGKDELDELYAILDKAAGRGE